MKKYKNTRLYLEDFKSLNGACLVAGVPTAVVLSHAARDYANRVRDGWRPPRDVNDTTTILGDAVDAAGV